MIYVKPFTITNYIYGNFYLRISDYLNIISHIAERSIYDKIYASMNILSDSSKLYAVLSGNLIDTLNQNILVS